MSLVHVDLGDAGVMIPRQPKEMMSVRREGDRTHVRINSSSLSIIQECLRKAKYSLEEGWKAETEGPPTLFGTAIHKALEVYYAGKVEDRILPTYEECEAIAYGAAPSDNLIQKAIYAFKEKASLLSGLPESDKRSIPNGVWILWNYFKTYIDDRCVVLEDEKGPFIERDFTFQIYQDHKLSIDYFGRIDAVFRDRYTNDIYLIDHKTTSSLGGYGDSSSYYEKDRPNAQYTGYWMGIKEVYGINPSGFAVNIIEVKAKPKTPRGQQSPQFPRQVTMRNEEDFLELRHSVVKAVKDYLDARESGVWPLGPVSSCNLWGACTYKQICSAPSSMRETILRGKFVR